MGLGDQQIILPIRAKFALVMTNTFAGSTAGRETSRSTPVVEDQSLLLDLPVPFRSVDGRLWVETQVLNGLRLWSENFNRLTVCAPLLPTGHSDEALHDWADPKALLALRTNIRFVALPWGYRHFDHFKFAAQVRSILSSLIDSHRYLCFSNVGGFGAWSSLGVDIALRRQHPYSVWFDNVAHEMPRDPAKTALQAIKIWLDSRYGKLRTMHAIRHAGLGLFHGRTVYEAYDAHCPRGELVHDIHCGPQDVLSDEQLAGKLARQSSQEVLRIGYAGRAHAIKGPFDWIATLAELARRVGPQRFKATWYGSGPALDEARQRVEAAGLSQQVSFAGHVRDREALLTALRELDVFLFCHLTPESPRCLIESLISCTPLVGYDSAYARDLLGRRGGGELVPIGDTTGLAAKLERLVLDRDALRELISCASSSRAIFNDEAVFKHRSELIKTHLKWQHPPVDNRLASWCSKNGISELVVVSPHLDDGVYSAHCALTLNRISRRLLATVFSDAPVQGQSDWARHTGFATNGAEFEVRRLEDQSAAQLVGADFLHLNQHVQQWSDAAAQSAVDRLLASLRSSPGRTLVLLPAGAGRVLSGGQRWLQRLRRLPWGPPEHGEHLMVRDRLFKPLLASGVHVGFYAELPYAWSDRMADLARRIRAFSGQALTQLEVPPDLVAKHDAACVYRSQLGPILGTEPAYQMQVLSHREVFFLPA